MKEIQKLLDENKGPFVELPAGEYKGNFVVHRPCTIIGNHTTLWAESGIVLKIDSNIVTVENLRVEVLEEDGVAIHSFYEDTRFHSVEVSGRVEGISSQKGMWRLPKIVQLGELPIEKETTLYCDVEVPVSCKIVSFVNGVHITPDTIPQGCHRLTLKIERLKKNTCIYGDILFVTDLIRRSYLTGVVSENIKEIPEEKVVYTIENKQQKIQNKNAVALPKITWDKEAVLLQKGQRISFYDFEEETIDIFFEMESCYESMEIDPYVFLLDGSGKIKKENDMIFFGNENAQDSSVFVSEKKVTVHLKKVSKEIERISIAYGIYESLFSFGEVKNPTIKLKKQQKEIMVFLIEDLKEETTIIAIDFYRYKGQWKVSAIGAGYKYGLKALCESYGLEVEET